MWPFTPFITFIANSLPIIGEGFLNGVQRAINDLVVRTAKQRVRAELGSIDGSQLEVRYVRGVYVKDYASSNWAAIEVPEPGVVLDVSDVVPAAGSFDGQTFYYVYLRSNNLVPEFEISKTAPGAGQFFKGTDETYRYIGCFLTGTGGLILPYQSRDGRFFYTGGDQNSYPTSPTDVTSTTWTTFDLRFAPPHARRATLRCDVLNTSDTTNETLRLLPDGQVGVAAPPANIGRGILCRHSPVSGEASRLQQLIELELGPGAKISARLQTGALLSSASLSVEGFEDW